jgi:hypothetical protein
LLTILLKPNASWRTTPRAWKSSAPTLQKLSQQGRDVAEAFGQMIFLEERRDLLTRDRDWFLRALEKSK